MLSIHSSLQHTCCCICCCICAKLPEPPAPLPIPPAIPPNMENGSAAGAGPPVPPGVVLVEGAVCGAALLDGVEFAVGVEFAAGVAGYKKCDQIERRDDEVGFAIP